MDRKTSPATAQEGRIPIFDEKNLSKTYIFEEFWVKHKIFDGCIWKFEVFSWIRPIVISV